MENPSFSKEGWYLERGTPMTMESSMRRDTLLVSSLVYVHHYWYMFTGGIKKWLGDRYDLSNDMRYNIYMIYTCMHVFVKTCISIYPLVQNHLPISICSKSQKILVFSARGVLLADEQGAEVVEWFGSIGRSMQTLFTIQTLAGWDSGTTMAGWMSEGVVSWANRLMGVTRPGKRLHSELERSIIFNGKFNYKWPFSIAMLVYRRVKVVISWCVIPGNYWYNSPEA